MGLKYYASLLLKGNGDVLWLLNRSLFLRKS